MTRRDGGGWSAALRIGSRLARREMRARAARVWLVAALIALPIAGMTWGLVVSATGEQTVEQRWTERAGHTDVVAWAGDEQRRLAWLRSLPEQSRIHEYQQEDVIVVTEDGVHASTLIQNIDLTDPLAEGIHQLEAGREVQDPAEIVLSRATARDLGVTVGDTVTFDEPVRASFIVVGLAEFRYRWGVTFAVIHPDVPIDWSDGSWLAISVPPGTDASALASHVERQREGDSLVFVSPRLSDAPLPWEQEQSRESWVWAAGLLSLAVTVVLVSGAFAVGARRQLVTLGQLAANGASQRTLRRVLLVHGAVLGLAGVVGGFAVALGGLLAVAPSLDSIYGRDVSPYTVPWWQLLVVATLGVVTSLVGSLAPARSASRTSVLAALAGRRPVATVGRWRVPTGGLVVVAGLGLLAVSIAGVEAAQSSPVWGASAAAGAVGVMVGVAIVTPALIPVLVPVTSQMSGAWRFTARALVRNRSRSSAVVTTIGTTAAVALAVAALYASATDRFSAEASALPLNHVQVWATQAGGDTGEGDTGPSQSVEPPEELVDRLAEELTATRHHVTMAQAPDELWSWQIPGDRGIDTDGDGVTDRPTYEDTHAVTILDSELEEVWPLTQSLIDGLHAYGAALVVPPEWQPSATVVTVEWQTLFDVGEINAPAAFEALLVTDGIQPPGAIPHLVMTSEAARDVGLEMRAPTVVLIAEDDLTTERAAFLQDQYETWIERSADGVTPEVMMRWRATSSDLSGMALGAMALVVTLVLTLVALVISLALSAAEGRDERDLLAVLGASPRLLTSMNGHQALMLSALGVAVAVPTGLLPVAVYSTVNSKGFDFTVPWPALVLVLLVVPAVAAGVTHAGTALASRRAMVTASSATWD